MYNKLGLFNHVIPVLSPVDIVSTATNSTHIKVTGHHTQFLVFLGTLTGDSCAITVEESTSAATTGAEAIPFVYQLTAAVGADTYAGVTTADSTGVDFTASNDDSIMIVEVDHSTLSSDCNYLSVLASPGASASACEIAVIAISDSRYPGATPVSAT